MGIQLTSRTRKGDQFEDDGSGGGDYVMQQDGQSTSSNNSVSPAQLRKVFWLNVAACIFQTLSSVAIFVLIDADKTYPFYTNYPIVAADQQQQQDEDGGRPDLGPDAQVAFRINVGYLSAAFLALSALDHLLVCTVGKGVYERGLSHNYNVFRWIEYALSASVMRILVGVLSGVSDLHMQFLQFGLTGTTMLFGLVFELENRNNRLSSSKPVRWYLYWLGFVPHAFSWTVIVGYFFYALSSGDSPPDFVYAIIFIIFFLDLTFPIILGLQWLGSCGFRDYVNGEIAFIILSFTSKNALAWIKFFGGNR